MSVPLSLAWVLLFLPAVLAAPARAEDADMRAIVERLEKDKSVDKIPLRDVSPKRLAVKLNVFYCAGAFSAGEDVRGVVSRDVEEADAALGACGLRVVPGAVEEIKLQDGSACTSHFSLTVDHDSPTLSQNERWLFETYHAAKGGGALSVFYLPWSSQGPTMAGTSIPADYIAQAKQNNAEDRKSIGALAIFHKARSFMEQRNVLPHEMGHILLDDSRHSTVSGNLMEAFGKGAALTKAQCAKMRASPFVSAR